MKNVTWPMKLKNGFWGEITNVQYFFLSHFSLLWEGMKWSRNLGFDEMEDIKRAQTHDKNVKNVWIEGISDYIDWVLHFINEETEAPTKYLAFTTSPLLIFFSTSPVGFHPLYATETLSGTLLTTIIYQIQWATPSPPNAWSLGSIWRSCPLLHYWLIYSVYHWFLCFFINDCLPLHAPLYVREPRFSSCSIFSLQSLSTKSFVVPWR